MQVRLVTMKAYEHLLNKINLNSCCCAFIAQAIFIGWALSYSNRQIEVYRYPTKPAVFPGNLRHPGEARSFTCR